MGYVLLHQGKSEQANKVLAHASLQHPRNPTLMCLLGRSYQALGQRDKAVKCYQAALTLQPDSAFTRMLASSGEAPQ